MSKLFLIGLLLLSVGLFAQTDPAYDEFLRQTTISEGNGKAVFDQYLTEEAELLQRYPDFENENWDWEMIADFLKEQSTLRKKWLARTSAYLILTENFLNIAIVSAQETGFPFTHESIYSTIKDISDQVDN
jgi:hypothetical protein